MGRLRCAIAQQSSLWWRRKTYRRNAALVIYVVCKWCPALGICPRVLSSGDLFFAALSLPVLLWPAWCIVYWGKYWSWTANVYGDEHTHVQLHAHTCERPVIVHRWHPDDFYNMRVVSTPLQHRWVATASAKPLQTLSTQALSPQPSPIGEVESALTFEGCQRQIVAVRASHWLSGCLLPK